MDNIKDHLMNVLLGVLIVWVCFGLVVSMNCFDNTCMKDSLRGQLFQLFWEVKR